MAGDWIPMRIGLADDPAVILISEATGLDEFGVVGRLHKLWSWANTHLVTGNAPSVTEKWIDRYLGVSGFATAMVSAGWLNVEDGGVRFPKFDLYNSQSAKKRLLTAKRVANHKKKGNAQGNAEGNAPSVTDALPKEEKRYKTPTESCDDQPKEPRKTPDSPHHRSVAHWCESWEKAHGAKYPFGKKDGVHVRDILRHLDGSEDRFREVVQSYLADNDQFVSEKNHPLGLLLSGLVKYTGRKVAAKSAIPKYDPDINSRLSNDAHSAQQS